MQSIDINDFMSSVRVGYDTTFEMNEFNEPRIRSDLETVANTILFVLFTKPGQYPSIPDLGLDIGSLLYSFYDELDTDDLVNDIIKQCEALDVYFNNGNILIKKNMYKDKPASAYPENVEDADTERNPGKIEAGISGLYLSVF